MGWRDGAEGRRRGGDSGGVEVVIVGGTSARRVREVLGGTSRFASRRPVYLRVFLFGCYPLKETRKSYFLT